MTLIDRPQDLVVVRIEEGSEGMTMMALEWVTEQAISGISMDPDEDKDLEVGEEEGTRISIIGQTRTGILIMTDPGDNA